MSDLVGCCVIPRDESFVSISVKDGRVVPSLVVTPERIMWMAMSASSSSE